MTRIVPVNRIVIPALSVSGGVGATITGTGAVTLPVTSLSGVATLGSGFARKPVIATPTIPTALRNLYASASASGGGSGTTGSPYTIAEAEAAKQAGDHIHLTGSFNITGDTYIGMDTTAGTSTNPIVYKQWEGQPAATLKLGGGGNGWDTVYFATSQDWHHWFYNLTLDAQTGADGGRAVALSNGSNYVKFLSCTFVNGACVSVLGSTHFEMWDCTTSGDTGNNDADNAGDTVFIKGGSDNFRLMRLNVTGRAAHTAVIAQGVTFADTIVDGGEIFDCDITNEWAGGLQVLGGCTNTHIHWNRITGVGTNPSIITPPGSREAYEHASSSNIIEFNHIYNNAASGLSCQTLNFGGEIELCASNIIRNNTIVGNGYWGLVFTAAATIDATTIVNNVVENNIIWGNSTVGVGSADGSSGYYNGHYYAIGFLQYNAATAWADNNFYGNIFRNNCLGRDTSDTTYAAMLVRLSSNAYYSLANVETYATGSANNLTYGTDPLLVSNADGHLTGSSPCIDAGYAYSGETHLGTAVDIGVFEYLGDD